MCTSQQTKILNQLALNPHLARHSLENVQRPAITELSTHRALKNTRSQYDLLDRTYLPDEILLQIFSFCFDHIAIPFERTDAPWTLTWTCARWRDIILNQPMAWHDVRGTLRKEGKHNIADMVHEVFRRSQRRPLRVTISGTVQKMAWGDVKRFIRPLLTESPARLYALTIDIPPQFLNWDCFLSIYMTHEAYSNDLWVNAKPRFKLSTIYPSLIELTIRNWGHCKGATVKLLETLVEGRLPYLDHLQLSTPKCHDNPSFIFRGLSAYSNFINWTNLSTLMLRDYIVMPWPRVQNLLRGCDRLIHLEISIGLDTHYPNENSADASSLRIGLPSLKTLNASLYRVSPEIASTLMREFVLLLDVPVITHLELNGRFRFSSTTAVTLSDIVANHIFTLKTLKVRVCIDMGDTIVDNYITALTNFQTLKLPISAGILSRAAIDAIASGEWETSIQDLTCMITDTDMEAFLDMLVINWSRSNRGSIAMRNKSKDNLQACVWRVNVAIRGTPSSAEKCGYIWNNLKKKKGLGDLYIATFRSVR